MTTATDTRAFEGNYESDRAHSSFGFSVVHNGISTFRGSLDDVDAALTATDGELALEGAAKVESISIREPEELRAHVLSEEFFDAANNPEVRFRSTKLELDDVGSARVDGELTIAGNTREVTATGTYQAPHDSLGGTRAALELETTFDRRDFGFDWQMQLPSGGDVLDWGVTLSVHLELIQAAGEDA